MRPITILPALACAALVACADQSPTSYRTAPTLSLEGTEQEGVPFKLHCDTYDFTLVEQTETFLHVTLRGTCEVSHLGRATVFIDQEDNATGFDPQTNVRSGYFTGTERIQAANGDLLIVSHQGPTTMNVATGAVTFGGTTIIEGGTGRFLNATGGGPFSGQASMARMSGSYDIDGRIVYAASGVRF